jgi:DNA topoisomerase-3
VYELVARRTVAALLSPAEWRATDLVAEIAGETLRARSRVLITPGWRAAEPASSADPAPDLSGIAQGAAATCASAAATQRQTQPPKRFTDASLLGAMETAGKQLQDPALREAMAQTGLGTPATRAATIETLIARGYAERQKKAIAATDKGIALVSLAPPSLTDPATTGEWEQRLREIEEGTQSAAEMDRDMAALAAEIVAQVAGQERVQVAQGRAVGTCPRCGGQVVEGKKGYGCSRWRREDGGCRFTIWKTVAGKALTATVAKELLERGETARVIRGFKSKAGKSFDARLRLSSETGRVAFVFAAPAAAASGHRKAAR